MFKKITILLILALLVNTVWARGHGLVYHEIQIVDELGRPVTDITNLYIYAPNTTTDAVIYMDRNLQNVITIPMTEASANTTLVDGRAYWWGPDGWDFSVSNDNAVGPMTNDGHEDRTASDGTLVFPSYFSSMATTAWLDAQSISMGTGAEWVINGGGVADTLSFIPAADDSSFIVGSVAPAQTASFYVPTGATEGFDIVGAALTWDGGAALFNHNSNHNVGLCTGTSTGATSIGNAAGGAFALDTDTTITVNADEGIAVTNTTAANDQVFTTAGNFQIIATEAASTTAVNIDITGAISGFDLDTTNGPVHMTAGDATNGDMTFVAENLMTLTSTDIKTFGGAVTELWHIIGTVAGDFEHRISFTDATADITWTFPDGGTDILAIMGSTLATNYPEIANSVTGGTSQLIFEGASENDHEAIIQATDPTGDIVWILPDIGTGAADNLAVVGSTFVTNYPEVANSVWLASNEIRFEGAAADAFESVITSADITGGVVTWTLADMGAADILSVMGSTLTTNAVGIANSVWGGTNQLIFEGATDDANYTAIQVTDPTATNTMTLPDDTGHIAWMAEAGTTTKDGTDAALPLTDAVVCGTSTAASAWSLPDGEEGQILTVVIVTDGGVATITPDTAAGCGWATVVLTDDIDGVTFMYVNDTVGWIILGTFSDGTNIVEVTQ